MPYHLKTFAAYQNAYENAAADPETFWGEIAGNFHWFAPWKKVMNCKMELAEFNWFQEGKTNISYNCLDRHLAEKGAQTALIFEPNDPKEKAQHISYTELHERVSQMANVLKANGIEKGDRVCIYLPMIPELAISVLACARIGAVHSVVFAGFSSTALASRIQDCACKLMITADGGFRGNKSIDLKSIVDEALLNCPTISKSLVVKRTNTPIHMLAGRDTYLDVELEKVSSHCDVTEMDTEDPLFILYTSGSTGKPKGMLHSTGGYMVYAGYTFQNVFDYQEKEVFWCTADIGWITGHSYIVYGPLLNGATTVLFEGIPSYPDFGRFWEVIDKHQVNHFYTAPTAIRSLAKEPLSWVEKYNLSSLRIIGSVGEPINDEAWHWYHEHTYLTITEYYQIKTCLCHIAFTGHSTCHHGRRKKRIEWKRSKWQSLHKTAMAIDCPHYMGRSQTLSRDLLHGISWALFHWRWGIKRRRWLLQNYRACG